MGLFSRKPKETGPPINLVENTNYSGIGREVKTQSGSIKKIKEGEFLISFNTPIDLPANNPLYKIKNIRVFSNDKLAVYSRNQLKFTNGKLKINFEGNQFVPDTYILDNISKVLHNGVARGEISHNHNFLSLSRYCWTFVYTSDINKRIMNKVFDLETGILVDQPRETLPIIFCKIFPEDYINLKIYKVENKNGALPKGKFNWGKPYEKIENNYGAIEKIGNWYKLTFKKEILKQIKIDTNNIPPEIFIYKSPFLRNEIHFEEFQKQIVPKSSLKHFVANDAEVKLISDLGLAQAIAIVIHGTTIEGPPNENFDSLELPQTTWVNISNNAIAYIDFELGVARIFDKDTISGKLNHHILTYRLNLP